jgi:hypothetical protein
MKKKNSKTPPKTVIDDVYSKLAELLSETEFTNSADVIEAFERSFPDDWKTLVEKYGHRDDQPGKKNRGHNYAASTYLADRLASMSQMGNVELKHTLDGYDKTVWKHNRRMGTWRLIRKPERVIGGWKFLTVRVSEATYEKLVAEASANNVSVAAVAATKVAA